MAGPSDRQMALLRRLRSAPAGRVGPELFDFIRRKPEEEQLVPDWHAIWDRAESDSKSYLPPSMARSISNELSAVPVIDPKINDIRISKNTNVTFLLGAGASAGSGIPTVNRLLKELLARARKLGRNDLDQLAQWCDQREITNIEDLLTAAYLSSFSAPNKNVTSLLDYFLFGAGARDTEEDERYGRRGGRRSTAVDVSSISFLQDTLQTLFGLLTSTMIEADPNAMHRAIAKFLKAHPATSIVTTNYDGCMDEAIVNSGLTLSPAFGQGAQNGKRGEQIELTKMHGSVNWAYCDSCQEAREFNLSELKSYYKKDKISFPVIGICKGCGGQRRPLLVPPLSYKFVMFPNLIEIWNSARRSIEGADYLFVVGYSFSEADTYITKIISRSMLMNPEQKMVVFDTNPQLVRSLRMKFSNQNDQFDTDRILGAVGRSEEHVPPMIDTILGITPKRKRVSKETVARTKKSAPRAKSRAKSAPVRRRTRAAAR